MAVDAYTFAEALIAWIANESDVVLAGTPRALWLGQAVEGEHCADPYSVLTPFASTLQPIGQSSLGVQIKTVGEDAAAAAQAATLFNVLLVGNVPRQQVEISGHKVIAFFNMRPPGFVSRDELRRVTIVSNFDAKYVAL